MLPEDKLAAGLQYALDLSDALCRVKDRAEREATAGGQFEGGQDEGGSDALQLRAAVSRTEISVMLVHTNLCPRMFRGQRLARCCCTLREGRCEEAARRLITVI